MCILHPQTKGRVLLCLSLGCGGKGDPKHLSRDAASCARTDYSCTDYLEAPSYLTKYVWSRFSEMEGPTGHQSENPALRTDFFSSLIFLRIVIPAYSHCPVKTLLHAPKFASLGAIVRKLSKSSWCRKIRRLLSPRTEKSFYLPTGSSHCFPGLHQVPDCKCRTARVEPTFRYQHEARPADCSFAGSPEQKKEKGRRKRTWPRA